MASNELPVPFQVLSKVFSFATADEEKWWLSTGPMFASMLVNAGYDLHIQYQYLCLHRDVIIPSLGPYPTPGKDRWRSVLSRYGLPFELSFNYSNSLARLAFEPVGPHAGTAQDPFNTRAIWDVLSRFEKLVPDLDLELARHFIHELVVSEAETAAILDDVENPYTGVARTQHKLGADLRPNGHLLLKIYICVETKTLATGKSRQQLIFDAIRKSDADNRFHAALSTLETFLHGSSTETPATGHSSLHAYFFSCDLIKRAHSRIKIYFMEGNLDLPALTDVWTLGNRRHDPATRQGLQYLEDLWTSLPTTKGAFILPDGFNDPGTSPTERMPYLVQFCLHPKDPIPEPQLYFPAVGHSDAAIADALTGFFERAGMAEAARVYKAQVQAY